MGSSPGKSFNQEHNAIPVFIDGYPNPEPPDLYIDDIRAPIFLYRDDPPPQDFDWSDFTHDNHNYHRIYIGTRGEDGTTPRTPGSVLRATSTLTRPLTNRPTRTESGRSITFMNQERARHALHTRSNSRLSAGAVSIHGLGDRRLPPDVPPLTFESIDQHARKAKSHHLTTYDNLIQYLKEPIKNHRLPEIMTSRALIVWLASQKVKKSFSVGPDITHPKGLIQLIARGTMTFAQAFTWLCRKAEIRCVLVEGLTKTGQFDPGTGQATTADDTWTAVHVEGAWQLLHPEWICKGLFGSRESFNEWARKYFGRDFKRKPQLVKNFKHILKDFINEDYFMPAPEVFIHMHYADDNVWQLLPAELRLTSRYQFLKLPVIFPAFFRLGLQLMSEQNCILTAKDGVCKIMLLCDHDQPHRITLSYDLKLLETHSNLSDSLSKNLYKSVIHARHGKQFYFEIRFPVEGIYIFKLMGGFHRMHTFQLCHFKLICNCRQISFRYVPYWPGKMMWGPGPESMKHGLLIPSQPAGVVPSFQCGPVPRALKDSPDLPYQPRTFMFQLDTEKAPVTTYSVNMIGFALDDDFEGASPFDAFGELKDNLNNKEQKVKKMSNSDFSSCASITRRDDCKEIVITATIPHRGEFALIITARKETKNGYKVSYEESIACVYLLKPEKEAQRESVHQKLARAELRDAILGVDVPRIRLAIEKCLKVQIPLHDEDVVAGGDKAELLTLKKEIFDAIHRRNLRIVNVVLQKLSKYPHQRALFFHIRHLFMLRKQLVRLVDSSRQDLPEMRIAISELVRIEQPPPEVHIPTAAMFLLLEEPAKYIDSWDYIREQMGCIEDEFFEPPIIRKVALLAEMCPSKNSRRKILSLLNAYPLSAVKSQSKAATTVYLWVKKVMDIFQDLDPEIDITGELLTDTAPDHTKPDS